MYQQHALVGQGGDLHRSTYRAPLATPAMFSIVARRSRLDQSRSRAYRRVKEVLDGSPLRVRSRHGSLRVD